MRSSACAHVVQHAGRGSGGMCDVLKEYGGAQGRLKGDSRETELRPIHPYPGLATLPMQPYGTNRPLSES
jgi:hypothetical protein